MIAVYLLQASMFNHIHSLSVSLVAFFELIEGTT